MLYYSKIRNQTNAIRIVIALSLLIFILFYSCKKQEERDLIKHYVGTYTVTRIRSIGTDSLNHLITTQSKIELEVKKSCKGIRIKGVEEFDNFEVNYIDSTIRAWKNDDSEDRADGKLLPNDSIYLFVSFSDKLPFGVGYSMKKKQ